jgi:nitroreductase
MRAIGILVCLLVLILVQSELVIAASSFENLVSQRLSIRDFTSTNVSGSQLLSILQSAYGSVGSSRTTPRVGSDYALVIFATNNTGTYRYDPVANLLSTYSGANVATISNGLLQDWQKTGNVILIFVWDQTKVSNPYSASLETGLVAQNVYIAAINQGLGTTLATVIDSAFLRVNLGLATSMTPLAIMPIGQGTYAYSSASPDFSRMTGNLPTVQISNSSFADVLNNLKYVQSWQNAALSQQELSQLLWAGYGYSSSGHRTVPSAGGIYPLVLYVSNALGTYRYSPETHAVVQVLTGDKRSDIASACNNQNWLASAPCVFTLVVDTSYNGGYISDGGVVEHQWIEADTGCVAQQILLEASARGLHGNLVTNGLDTWNGNTAQTLRNVLQLGSSSIALCVLPVGYAGILPTPTSTVSPTVAPSATPTQPANTQDPTTNPTSPGISNTPEPSITPTPPPIPEFTPAFLIIVAVASLIFLLITKKKQKFYDALVNFNIIFLIFLCLIYKSAKVYSL